MQVVRPAQEGELSLLSDSVLLQVVRPALAQEGELSLDPELLEEERLPVVIIMEITHFRPLVSQCDNFTQLVQCSC